MIISRRSIDVFCHCRYPEEIEERAAASAQKLADLKREKAAKERAERKLRFDQYFQPFAYGL